MHRAHRCADWSRNGSAYRRCHGTSYDLRHVQSDRQRNARMIEGVFSTFTKLGCRRFLRSSGSRTGSRDVSADEIRAMMRIELSGFGYVIRAESMKITPNSILSRSMTAIVDLSLVIAL